VHEIAPALLDGLWRQCTRAEVAADGLLLAMAGPAEAPMPKLPPFFDRDVSRADFGRRDLRGGFTLDLWLDGEAPVPLDSETPVLLDTRTPDGRGLCLRLVDGAAEIAMRDGQTECRWTSDPGLLAPGAPHHLAVIVDGGPKLILFLVDGRLCDGGADRQFGWGRFSPHLRAADGAETLRLAPAVTRLRLYGRALRVSEAIANYRADCAGAPSGV